MTTIEAPQRFDPDYASTHLGASEWPAAVGVSPWAAPVDAWARKIGAADPIEHVDAMDLGHDLEAGIVLNALRQLGRRSYSPPVGKGAIVDRITGQVTYENPLSPWSIATPDAWASPTDLVQAKMRGSSDGWDDDPPEDVIVQVTGELVTTRMWCATNNHPMPERVHVAALLPEHGRKLSVRMFVVPWDAELAAMLVTRVRAFWQCVQTRTPPPADASEDYSRYLARRYPKPSKDRIEASAMVEAFALDYIAARAEEEAAHKRKVYAQNAICEQIGDAYGAKGDGWLASWYPVKGKRALDVELLKQRLMAEVGDARAKRIIEECHREGKPYRGFKLTKQSNNGDDDNG